MQNKRGGLGRRGITLIAAVMLIVFASIAVLGVTTFIVQRLVQLEAGRRNISCLYLAQAGINRAIYDFRFHDLKAAGYFTLGQDNIDADNFFVLGGSAGDLLMLNSSLASLAVVDTDLINLQIQNATDSTDITIDRMVVSWNNSRRLQVIRIDNSDVWTGNAESPADADITNFTLDTTPTIYPIDYLRFDDSMAGSTISIQFVMTDGSSRSLTVYPASNNYNFTLKSTGKTSASNFFRTIQADYNALTGRIIDYHEINNEITP